MSDQTAEAFEELQEAFRQFAHVCEEIWNAIVEIVAPIIKAVIRWYRQCCAAHLIPRQYQLTMARRKIRHYALFYARRV